MWQEIGLWAAYLREYLSSWELPPVSKCFVWRIALSLWQCRNLPTGVLRHKTTRVCWKVPTEAQLLSRSSAQLSQRRRVSSLPNTDWKTMQLRRDYSSCDPLLPGKRFMWPSLSKGALLWTQVCQNLPRGALRTGGFQVYSEVHQATAKLQSWLW